MRIKSIDQLNETIKSGPYAFPGGYPLYFITANGSVLSFNTVINNLENVRDSMQSITYDGWCVIACEINWEGPLYCGHTGERIESAY